MEKVSIKRYSEAFRRAVVREYEAGGTLPALQKKYGITGSTTITRWVQKYGLQGLRHQLIRIQTMDEAQRVKDLEHRIQELEGVVTQLLLDKLMLESTLRVVETEYGVDVKKNAPRSLPTPKPGWPSRAVQE